MLDEPAWRAPADRPDGSQQPRAPDSATGRRGKSTADIADTLFLSPKTVDTYRSRLMQKLDIDSFAALVKFAIACGLTPP